MNSDELTGQYRKALRLLANARDVERRRENLILQAIEETRHALLKEHVFPAMRAIADEIRVIQLGQTEAAQPDPNAHRLPEAKWIEERTVVPPKEEGPPEFQIFGYVRFFTRTDGKANGFFVGFDPIGRIDDNSAPEITSSIADTVKFLRTKGNDYDKVHYEVLAEVRTDDREGMESALRLVRLFAIDATNIDLPGVTSLRAAREQRPPRRAGVNL